jgi:F-type H+-transporting ATPase subunit b
MKTRLRRLFLGLLLLGFSFACVGQESGAASKADAPGAQSQATQQPENPNSAIGQELSSASHEAAETAEHEENAQFKYSRAVRWIANHLNGDPRLAYLVSLIVNFGLLALFFYMLLRSKMPQMFRDRTASIQQGIRQAQAASAEAAQRLKQVEAHLAQLDTQVADIRREAEQNAAAEEGRIRKAAEEDKQRVVEAAESEISAITRNARRELKSYVASLAVDLAGSRIHVDEDTDRTLVREFVDHLGKDGR